MFKVRPQPCLHPIAGHLVCQKTQQACFCTSECVAAAEHTVGGPDMALRKVLAAVPWAKLSIDECNQARFMLHVLSLRRDSSCSEEAGKKWAQFCSLHALPPDSSTHDRVWEVIRTLIDPDVSHDDVSLCLRKEAANAFGIMAPLGKDVRFHFAPHESAMAMPSKTVPFLVFLQPMSEMFIAHDF